MMGVIEKDENISKYVDECVHYALDQSSMRIVEFLFRICVLESEELLIDSLDVVFSISAGMVYVLNLSRIIIVSLYQY